MMHARKTSERGFAIYLAVALTVSCLLALYYVVKQKAFVFYDHGSDTLSAYYAFQVAVSRQLHELHKITWSFDLGLGGYLGSFFDPIWLLTGWLPESWQLPARLPMYFSQLVAGGGFFYAYLRLIGIRPLLAAIGGLCFAFSSYGTINAQWDIPHGTEFVQFPAFLFLLEHYFRFGKRRAAVAAGVVVGIGAPFGVYLLGLFGVLYAVARLIAVPRAQRGDALRRIAGFVPWCATGLALMAPLIFPELYYLLENPRVSGERSGLPAILRGALSLNDRSIIGAELAGFVGKDLLGSNMRYSGWQNYFEGPGFYIGLLPLLCAPQLLGRNASRAERTMALTAIVGCALYVVFPALRYAVYGFGHMAFRSSTLWISALLLVLGITGLQRALLSGWWRTGILLGAGFIIAIVVGAVAFTPGVVNVEHVVRVLAFTALNAAVLFLAATSGGRSWAFEYLLIAVCTCELMVFAIPPLIERDAVGADGSSPAGRYDDGTQLALKYVHDHDYEGDLFRIEKTYSSVFLNDSLVQDYAGTAQYAFNASSPMRLVDKLALPRAVVGPNYIGPMTSRPLILDLLAVRYVLTRKRSLDNSGGMVYLKTVDDIDVYRNDAAHGFGTFHDAIVSEAEADALPVPQRDALVLEKAIVEDPAVIEAQLAPLRAAPALPDVHRRADIVMARDDELTGDADTPTGSLLLLAMPFDSGWRAWLDGRDVALFRADYGLTALLVPAGSHKLALRYSPPARALGFSVMAGAIAFLIIFTFFPGAGGALPRLAAPPDRWIAWFRRGARRADSAAPIHS